MSIYFALQQLLVACTHRTVKLLWRYRDRKVHLLQRVQRHRLSTQPQWFLVTLLFSSCCSEAEGWPSGGFWAGLHAVFCSLTSTGGASELEKFSGRAKTPRDAFLWCRLGLSDFFSMEIFLKEWMDEIRSSRRRWEWWRLGGGTNKLG